MSSATVALSRPVLLPAHRHWLVANALLASANINLLLNAGIGFASAHGHDRLPTWSTAVTHSSVLGDSLGALFFLPFFTCLLVTTGVRRELADGALPRLSGRPTGRWWRLIVRDRTLARAARFGAATFVVLAVPVGVVVRLAIPHGLASHDFAIFHVLYTVGLGAIMTPLIAYAAMTDQPAVG